MSAPSQEAALQEIIDLGLSNPFQPENSARWRVMMLRRQVPSGTDIKGWGQWWSGLPGQKKSMDAPAIAMGINLFRSARGPGAKPDSARVARILPEDMQAQVMEVIHRADAVERALEMMVGDSSTMRRLREETWSAALGQNLALLPGLTRTLQSTPVLIQGDTGTGKELVARALCKSMSGKWEQKPKWTAAPAESVHLGSIPQELVSSALFGHKKGAFTGALKDQDGVLERCNRGVVFLDEVAELPPETQVKLLRVLQEGMARPLGSSKEVEAAPRLISATHQNLEAFVEQGKFRQDLYHRISAVVIHLPRLCQRLEDIEALADVEIKNIDRALRPQVKEAFLAFMKNRGEEYTWPGNIRELHGVVRNLALEQRTV